MDVNAPLSRDVGCVRVDKSAFREKGKNRAAKSCLSLSLSGCVLLRGSDSTCLRRLGLSPGSIFALLFCDPVDFEGREEVSLCVEKLRLQPVSVISVLWQCVALHKIYIYITLAAWMCAGAAVPDASELL